jgi:hypothetical protein
MIIKYNILFSHNKIIDTFQISSIILAFSINTLQFFARFIEDMIMTNSV